MRSALHWCLQRHGISRLPDVDGDIPKRQRFKRYPPRYFKVEINSKASQSVRQRLRPIQGACLPLRKSVAIFAE